jgi:hypothetical protein
MEVTSLVIIGELVFFECGLEMGGWHLSESLGAVMPQHDTTQHRVKPRTEKLRSAKHKFNI